MRCSHELNERETACADGFCPLCLAVQNKKLRKALKEMDNLTYSFDSRKKMEKIREEAMK